MNWSFYTMDRTFSNSLLFAPRAKNILIINSSETLASACSAFAYRDWLVFARTAAKTWVFPQLFRLLTSAFAKATFISTIAISAGLNPKKLSTSPTIQPFFSRRSFFCLSIFSPSSHKISSACDKVPKLHQASCSFSFLSIKLRQLHPHQSDKKVSMSYPHH